MSKTKPMKACQILTGDCLEILPTLEADSVDAIVTDPPYGIGFMGREWDTFSPAAVAKNDVRFNHTEAKHTDDHDNPNIRGRSRFATGPSIEYDYSASANRKFQTWTMVWASSALRVLKPGGCLLVCMSPRTAHRVISGIEDAGFEVRDQVLWIYGQGMPKSVDVGRSIDMDLCQEPGRHWMRKIPKEDKRLQGDHVCAETDSGRQWAGWGTGLKPCYEPVVMARKPMAGTNARNVQEYGVGGINVDACRIDTAKGDGHWSGDDGSDATSIPGYEGGFTKGGKRNDSGRWPPNVVMDEDAAAMVDEQSGELTSGANPTRRGSDKSRVSYSAFQGQEECTPARGHDSGGASRFFYCPKTSRSEREAGCESLPIKSSGELTGGRQEGSEGLKSGRAGAGRSSSGRHNHHPTVKPIEVMRWLVRLVTPPGGTVLDPFFGSGTTGIACELEDFSYIGIEKEAEYVPIAEARIEHVRKQKRAFEAGGPLFA